MPGLPPPGRERGRERRKIRQRAVSEAQTVTRSAAARGLVSQLGDPWVLMLQNLPGISSLSGLEMSQWGAGASPLHHLREGAQHAAREVPGLAAA